MKFSSESESNTEDGGRRGCRVRTNASPGATSASHSERTATAGRTGKPIWLTIAIFLIGFAVFALKQKGYLGGAASNSQTPANSSTQTTSANQQQTAERTSEESSIAKTSEPVKSAPTQPASQTAKTSEAAPRQQTPKPNDDGGIAELFRKKQSDTWVEATGTIKKMLPDDTDGDKHQRFIVKLSTNIEILIAHNIDTAPRVPAGEGDAISFRGEYEWTEKGGTVHFTHAPKFSRKTPGGWIDYKGKRYE